MAQRGKPSIAHEYDSRDCCIHCGMYRVNLEQLSHVCKPARVAIVDEHDAKKAGMSVRKYRLGRDWMEEIHGKGEPDGE